MPSVPDGPWFNEVAAFLGRAYLRNAFTMGTEQEVEFVVDVLGLQPGMRVLDVGCGPGRHALALARRGMEVTGVDLSTDFVELARAAAAAEQLPAQFTVADVRDLTFDSEFDAVVCLCQGGFGLLGGHDEPAVFSRIVAGVHPGGGIALSAFSAYFALRFLEAGETFDPATGVLHETSIVRNDSGEERAFELWTTCFTARELELLARGADVDVQGVYGVAPGKYEVARPDLDRPELLLVGHRRA
ncbi:MAG TPA: class I SAM-dependent methyltransferase [Acidimicrobiia bacterium]|nr:class I SAM-dependent methyltransferase [Acidimicrobiia bacterium]